MGIGWWVILPDDTSFFTKTKPEGATITKPSNRPVHTVQSVRGKPRVVTADLGIVDIKLNRPGTRPGRAGAISFGADPGRRTKQAVKLGRSNGLRSFKVGRIYKTPTRGGTLLSRRPLSRRR